MFSLFKKKEFFSKEENEKIVAAIRHAEECTSGEVRVFVESRCKFIDPLDRAMEIFSELKMQQTKDRNAVIVYVAIKDRQLAIYGDSGINAKTGEQYWKQEVDKMISKFNRE
ncbi:MAG TPA: TPM domain-containing protein, partial [Chitinophagaceae bacterium]|nr:TPM domain-containing protein [Chitinophagaceae bacterium]